MAGLMEAYASGAEAMQKVYDLPVEAERLRTRVETEKMDLEASKKYMEEMQKPTEVGEDKTAALEKAATPYAYGKEAASIVSFGKDLQQRKAEIAKMEKALAFLPPGHAGRANIENNITRRQKEIDRVEEKMLNASQRFVDEQTALYSVIKDQDSLNQARRLEQEQLNIAAAEQGIPQEQIPEWVKQHSKLPAVWNNETKAFIEYQLNRGRSQKEILEDRKQANREKAENDRHQENLKKIEQQQRKADVAVARKDKLEAAKTASENSKERRINLDAAAKAEADAIKYEADARELEKLISKTPDEPSKWHLFSPNEPAHPGKEKAEMQVDLKRAKEQADRLRKQAESYRKEADKYKNINKALGKEFEDVEEKAPVKTGTKEHPIVLK